MTTEEKVTLVETAKDAYGLNQSLRAIGLPKSTWYYHRNKKVTYEEKYAEVLPDMEEIALEHPEYRWSPMQAELNEEYGHHINRSSAAIAEDDARCGSAATCVVLSPAGFVKRSVR